MSAMKEKPCYKCGSVVGKDVIALNKKLLGHLTRRVLCMTCLSEYLGCTVSDLENLMRQFKEQGCALFVGKGV